MPRSAVYDQLQWHSHESNLEPISSSTLGKLINSVFPGVMTRRLGTRYPRHTHTHTPDMCTCTLALSSVSQTVGFGLMAGGAVTNP